MRKEEKMSSSDSCPNPDCLFHRAEFARKTKWKAPHGSYKSKQHGILKRYRCLYCGKTFSERRGDDSFRLHRDDIDGGELVKLRSSGVKLKDIADMYGCTVIMVRTRIKRHCEKEIQRAFDMRAGSTSG